MNNYIIGILVLLFTAPAASTPSIEYVEPTPGEDLNHGDGAVLATEILEADSAYVTVDKNGEKITSRTLYDRNSDNVYVNQMLEGAEGYQTYSFEVKACNTENCVTETVSMTAECGIGIFGKCLR